jgi:hypothetical protein
MLYDIVIKRQMQKLEEVIHNLDESLILLLGRKRATTT